MISKQKKTKTKKSLKNINHLQRKENGRVNSKAKQNRQTNKPANQHTNTLELKDRKRSSNLKSTPTSHLLLPNKY